MDERRRKIRDVIIDLSIYFFCCLLVALCCFEQITDTIINTPVIPAIGLKTNETATVDDFNLSLSLDQDSIHLEGTCVPEIRLPYLEDESEETKAELKKNFKTFYTITIYAPLSKYVTFSPAFLATTIGTAFGGAPIYSWTDNVSLVNPTFIYKDLMKPLDYPSFLKMKDAVEHPSYSTSLLVFNFIAEPITSIIPD